MTDAIARYLQRPESPAIVLTFPLEAAPSIRIDAKSEGEQLRAVDWVRGNPVLAEIVQQVADLRERYGRAA
jgi:hypothetical protein